MEPKDLDRQISANKLGNLYFFYGEEQFLLENKIKSIKSLLVDKDFEDLNFTKLEGKKTTCRHVEEQLLSVPVMSDKKMVAVKDSGIFKKANEEVTKAQNKANEKVNKAREKAAEKVKEGQKKLNDKVNEAAHNALKNLGK